MRNFFSFFFSGEIWRFRLIFTPQVRHCFLTEPNGGSGTHYGGWGAVLKTTNHRAAFTGPDRIRTSGDEVRNSGVVFYFYQNPQNPPPPIEPMCFTSEFLELHWCWSHCDPDQDEPVDPLMYWSLAILHIQTHEEHAKFTQNRIPVGNTYRQSGIKPRTFQLCVCVCMFGPLCKALRF